MQAKRDYLSNLDVLRFLAALWVVATHYGHIGPAWEMVGYGVPEGAIFPFLRYGYLGVPIFFCLSGFLIAHVSANTDAIRFGANRVLRLMPGFWISMTLTAIITAMLGTPHGISFAQWVANLTLVPQFFGFGFVDGVYWTLVYEFIFYGWVAILLLVGIFHSRMIAVCAVWLAITALNQYVLEYGPFLRLFITEYSGSFVAGLMFWHIRRHGLSIPAVLLIGVSIFLLGNGLYVAGQQSFLVNPPPPLTFANAQAFSLFIIALVGAGVFAPQLQRGQKTLMLLGGISYPLYLVHQEIGYALFRHFDGVFPTLPMVLFTAFAAIIVAWAIHVFGETPMRKLLQRVFMPLVNIIADAVLALRARIMRSPSTLPAE
ncbi:MAG: acyltransferase [Ahrensia sp.]